MNLEKLRELDPKILEFDCKDFDGKVNFIWTNKSIEYKYFNYEFATLIEEALNLRKELLLYRGTTLDRLSYAISNGTTSKNKNEGFWGSLSLDKAMEYGHLILCYDYDQTDCSSRTFDLENLDETKLQELRGQFKSEEISKDKNQIFFSMFHPDRRGRVHYEREYGHYIPGDEKKALKRLVILGGGSLEELQQTVANFRVCGGSLQKDEKELFAN